MSETESPPISTDDEGALSLAFILQLLGLPADAAQIVHQSGKAELNDLDLLRAAKAFPVKARLITSDMERLAKTHMPCLALMRDGGWWVLGQVGDDKLLVKDPTKEHPESVEHARFIEEWSGKVLLISRRAPLTDPHRRFDISWFVAAVQKYRSPMIEVVVASFFLQVFALLAPLFFQVIIDKVFVHRGLSTLEVLAIGLGVMSFFEVVLGGLRTYLFNHTSNRVDVELGARVFRHLFALPLAYFQSRRVGDTVARVRELDTIRQFLTSSAITLTLDLFFALIFLAVLFIYSPWLALVAAAPLPFYVLISIGVTPLFRRRLNQRFRRGAENQAFLVESISGAETIKSMSLEPAMQRRWEEQIAGFVGSTFRVSQLSMLATQTVTMISKVVAVAILFLGARLVVENQLTVGELVAFNMIAGQLTAPVLRLAQLWQDFQQVRISVERLGDILNATPEPSAEGSANLPPIRGDIELENVSFRYRTDAAQVLQRISLQIPAGQVLGVVGASGSGKSTFAKLIQRLYVPETGRLLVDGVDLAVADPAWLRRQIGVVLQENVLFNRSVRENIALADPGMPMDRVIAAAQLAGAHEFILGLPEGYATIIGERGATLSGGQRQRIAIARALINEPRILIFDEATSALDYESEAAIQANMRRICAGRTVIIIAHRLSTLRTADRIITIEHGQIIEDGVHAGLLAANGRYAHLWRLQSGETPAPISAVAS